MDKESVLKLSYEENEVVSAQRMRFLDSSRLKMLGILGVACTAILTGQQMYYWYDKGTIPVTWFMPLIVAAIFVLVPTLVYLFAPQVDFRINPRWRHELDLHICEDKLRLTAKGKSDGFELQWSRVKWVLENPKIYILFFGSEQDFLILPKRVFKERENFFREILKQKTSPKWKSKN